MPARKKAGDQGIKILRRAVTVALDRSECDVGDWALDPNLVADWGLRLPTRKQAPQPVAKHSGSKNAQQSARRDGHGKRVGSMMSHARDILVECKFTENKIIEMGSLKLSKDVLNH